MNKDEVIKILNEIKDLDKLRQSKLEELRNICDHSKVTRHTSSATYHGKATFFISKLVCDICGKEMEG